MSDAGGQVVELETTSTSSTTIMTGLVRSESPISMLPIPLPNIDERRGVIVSFPMSSVQVAFDVRHRVANLWRTAELPARCRNVAGTSLYLVRGEWVEFQNIH